ncbi:hypothetical protein J9332_43160, partial [Aquimarina celericrescens]|nr:hypothetical protein [Aquimarina celericrescens]
LGKTKNLAITGGLNAGVSYNSNQGLSSFNISSSLGLTGVRDRENEGHKEVESTRNGTANFKQGSGSASFNNITLTPRKRTAFV